MNAYYRLYILSVIKLVATLVIKSKYTATAINTRLIQLGNVVDPDDPYSWKYYLNLSGVYHATNTVMQVTSLDTQETIDFTKANLLIHRATRKEYTYGSRYYNDLRDAYPDQEMLINGIINPINIDTAIGADDHTILSYDTSLVEAQEQRLLPDLQRYVSLYFNRYDNPDYGLFEPYYYPLLISGLYSKLVLEVLNSRLRCCKTQQAHTYHIRQYLLSHNNAVGLEFDYMTMKQRLFLYRNILYLNRNLGRRETFEWLTQKILTDRGFSLAGYNISQTYDKLEDTLKPTIQLDRFTINGIDPAAGSNEKTVGELLDLELPLARDNPIVRDDIEKEAIQKMQVSLFNQLPTKVLESNVVDRSDAEPFTITEVLLNHWIYLSHYDRYTSVVRFINPGNGDLYSLSVKNAFIFYLYAFNMANGIELIKVPVIGARRVRRIPLPTLAELQGAVNKSRVPNYYLRYILETQVPISRYVSTESFNEMCQDVHDVMIKHRNMRHYNGDYKVEGELHRVIDRCYMDIRIDLAGEQDYDLWLKDNGIDTSSMGHLEYAQMATDILQTATGVDVSNVSAVREIHAAMLRIMRTLSSYSVQYIGQINDSPIKIIDGKFPKLSKTIELLTEDIPIEITFPEIMDVHAIESEQIKMPTKPPCIKFETRTEEQTIHVPVCVPVKLVGSGSHPNSIPLSAPGVGLLRPPVTDLSAYAQTGVAGYLPIPEQDLSDLVISSELSGYDLLTEARRKLLLKI
jgi:hypothetical protein